MIDPDVVCFLPTQGDVLEEDEENAAEAYSAVDDLLGNIYYQDRTNTFVSLSIIDLSVTTTSFSINIDLHHLESPTLLTLQADTTDQHLLKLLYSGYSDLSKASRVFARGMDKIKSVVAIRPDLQQLNKVMDQFLPPMGITKGTCTAVTPYSSPVMGDRNETYFPGTYSGPKPFPDDFTKPKRPKEKPHKFQCGLCLEVMGSWGKCDAHIRSQHSGMKYGPCPGCKKYYSWNKDAYRVHVKRTCKYT